MTIVNLRFINGLCIALVSLYNIVITGLPMEGREGIPGFYIFGPALVGLIYLLACLLEPAWVRRLHRKSGRPKRLPFETVLMQYQFGLELQEVLYFEKGIKRPAFSSGNPISPRRIYLHRGVEDKLNPQQLQGLFAVQLAALVLERDTKLWASGGAVFLTIFSILLVMPHLLPGVTVSSQVLLAAIPVLIYIMDLVFLPLSRHLVYLSDRIAARVLVYPDCLLSYLGALALLEREEGEEGGSDYWEKGRSKLLQFFPSASPYPSAPDRLKRLGKIYPEAEAIARRLKEEVQAKGLHRLAEGKRRHLSGEKGATVSAWKKRGGRTRRQENGSAW